MSNGHEDTNQRRRMVRCTLILVCCITVVYHWTEMKYQNSIWKRRNYSSFTKISNGLHSSTNTAAVTDTRTKHSNTKDPIKKPVSVSFNRMPTSFLPWNVSLTIRNTPFSNLQSIQTIYQYYLQHSVDAVVLDASTLDDRQFAVGFLPCANDPDVGAIAEWHNFFNTLAWSIITNRTVIVQWYDPEQAVDGVQTIHALHRNYTCSTMAASKDLKLASWFLQWGDIQQLDADLYQESIVPIPLDVQRQNYDTVHRIVAFPQIVSLRYRSSARKDDVFFHNEWNDHPLSGTNAIQYIKFMNESSRLAALYLFYEGSDFLYGAFFHICFPYFNLGDLIAPVATKNQSPKPADMSFSLVTIDETADDKSDDGADDRNDDDGSTTIDISNEIKCLRRLLPLKADREAAHCQIVVLSNNPVVVERLIDWIASSKRSCKVLSRKSLKKKRKQNDESASPSSAIPLSDLRFASNIARTGIIGPPKDPSYQLLVEWMEFHRTMEALTGRRKVTSISTSANSTVPPLLWCDL